MAEELLFTLPKLLSNRDDCGSLSLQKGLLSDLKSERPYKTLISFFSEESTKLLTVSNILVFQTKCMSVKQSTLMSWGKILDININIFGRKIKESPFPFFFSLCPLEKN